jgi:hypothetical protein
MFDGERTDHATFHEVNGTDIPHALLDFARAVAATQLVLLLV